MSLPRILGRVLLVALPAVLIALLLTPAVRRPLGRALSVLGADLFASADGDRQLPVATTAGVKAGDPIFLATRAGSLRPVAWVAGVSEGQVGVRFAPGEALSGDWRLDVIASPSGFADSWQLALPVEVSERLQRRVRDRVRTLLDEAILPEARRRLPAFLERVDPRKDERAREVADAVAAEVIARLRPYGDDLTKAVARDLQKKLDLLDRLGLLWKVVQGDGEGIREDLVPVALATAERWWSENRNAVMTAVGEGVAAQASAWQAWLADDVLSAAREELAGPILDAQRSRLEQEADRLLNEVLNEVVAAPEGGLRVRFAAMVRSRLLEKDAPLLLLEPIP